MMRRPRGPRPRGTTAGSRCARRAGPGQPCSRRYGPSSATDLCPGQRPERKQVVVLVDRRHRQLWIAAVEPVLQQDEQESEQRQEAGEGNALAGADCDVLDAVEEALV